MYVTFLLKISYKDELFKFMDDLEDHYNRYTGKDKLVYSKWLKMHIYGWTITCTIMIMIMSGTAIYFNAAGYFDPAPFPKDGPWGIVGLVFSSYVSVIGSSVVYFTICLFAIVCGIVYKEFVTTRENLESIIESNSSCGECNLRRIRQRHQNLCSMVQQGNSMFSGILAVLYSTNIFMACLMSYNLLDGNMPTIRIVIGAMWTLAAFLNFLGISVLASFLNSAVSKTRIFTVTLHYTLKNWLTISNYGSKWTYLEQELLNLNNNKCSLLNIFFRVYYFTKDFFFSIRMCLKTYSQTTNRANVVMTA